MNLGGTHQPSDTNILQICVVFRDSHSSFQMVELDSARGFPHCLCVSAMVCMLASLCLVHKHASLSNVPRRRMKPHMYASYMPQAPVQCIQFSATTIHIIDFQLACFAWCPLSCRCALKNRPARAGKKHIVPMQDATAMDL